MRFELAVAFKYLLPRMRQLSVSIISLLSVLVISLVVWLVIVFLSVTHGIEKKWLEELVTLNAPLRMLPTEEYYNSYYHNIDSLSDASGYSTKSLGEKLLSKVADPYDPTFDATLPSLFPEPDRNGDGSLKDLVKEGKSAIDSLKSGGEVRATEYEVSFGNLDLDLYRKEEGETRKGFLTQLCYISSFDKENHRLGALILPPREKDLNHLLARLLNEGGEGANQNLLTLLFSNGVVPTPSPLGHAVLISKNFQQSDVRLGDTGSITYYAPSHGAMKEHKLPVYVAGFYDPGLMPVGNKVIFADASLLATIRNDLKVSDTMLGNGFHIFVPDLERVAQAKEALQRALQERGIERYFRVESYSDYDFAKPVLEQLKSDKLLFTLIALIILIVACSNIISMLILLVNDKRKEIGILQSMGISTKRIALIFGLCGTLMGVISSVIGMASALLTLHNLQAIVNFLSFLQGREAFQAAFYGTAGLPNELSLSVLTFVVFATILLSLLAGIVPAIKAAKIRPAAILRSE